MSLKEIKLKISKEGILSSFKNFKPITSKKLRLEELKGQTLTSSKKVNIYNTKNIDSAISKKFSFIYLLQGGLIASLFGLLFYRSLMGILLLTPIIYFHNNRKQKKVYQEKKWRLNLEFRDALLALSAALEAGYAVEHAFEEAYKDLRQLYPENEEILKEIQYIINQINMNITVEKALINFSERSGVEDIYSFSEVFCTAKRTGGDLISIIKSTSNIINNKIEVNREIRILIASKRLEANIMKAIPLVILIYLTVSSPGFLDPLYHNLKGNLLMTIFIGIYFASLLIIDKIVAIEV
ncbi:MAG: putative rane protein [Herbinix sp.]|jgi:tight adherence protein B|nr:putative rane protein [Herbinix sp.]